LARKVLKLTPTMPTFLQTQLHSHPRRAAAALLAALVLSATPVAAEPVRQPDGWALGLMLGAPSGLTLKHWFGGSNAFDLGIGVGPGIRLHADYLWGISQLLSNKSDLTLDLYIGLGGVVGIPRGWCGTAFRPDWGCRTGDIYGGARVPFGLDARLSQAPITFGLEVAPGLWFGDGFVAGLLDAFLFVRFLL